MSKKANIYSFKESMTQKQLVQFLNMNFKSLAKATNIQLKEIKTEQAGVHNELSGRDKPDCHPVSAISSLSSVLETITNTLNNMRKELDDMIKDIEDIQTKCEAYELILEDHEERIEELEK